MKLMPLIMLAAVLGLPSATAGTVDATAEIESLLVAVGSSSCTFVRNGKHHDAANAEAHLRMKLKRGKRYVSTAESFIERLASQSSMSRKPYFIECPGFDRVSSRDWFLRQLDAMRTPL